MKLREYKTHIKLHAIVFLLGFTGILGALTSIPSVTLVWYRMLIAFCGLIFFLIAAKSPIKIPLKPLMQILGNGALIGCHWIFFFESIKVSNVSVALACLASVSLFTSILEPFILKRRIISYELFLGILVVAGLYLIFRFEIKYTTGIFFGVVSAFFAALFSTINAVFVKEHKPDIITTYEMLGGFIGITLYLAATSQINMEDMGLYPHEQFGSGIGFFQFSLSMNIICLLLLGLLCSSYAFVVTVSVMKELTPFTVNITFNLEPVYAIIFALLLFGEQEYMTAWFYIGAIVILCSIFANALLKKGKGAGLIA